MTLGNLFSGLGVASPSSRRAWIEIIDKVNRLFYFGQSPSSRRAWIEILLPLRVSVLAVVALLTEGVDRNSISLEYPAPKKRRPPHGGRG